MKNKFITIAGYALALVLAVILIVQVTGNKTPATNPTGPAQMETKPNTPDSTTPAGTEATKPGTTDETTPGIGETKPGTTETQPAGTGETTPGTQSTTPATQPEDDPDVGPTAPPPPQQSELTGLPLVTFLSGESTVSIQKVAVGSLPEPPVMNSHNDDLVFAGWDKVIAPVTGDTEYKAVYTSIAGKSNVFALDTYYTTDPGNAKLTLSLKGDVKLCVADLQIRYDPNVIRIDDVRSVDPSIQYNILPEEGRIKVSMLLQENMTYSMDCFQLCISFVDGSANIAELSITVEDAAYLTGPSTLADATAETISGKIVCIR